MSGHASTRYCRGKVAAAIAESGNRLDRGRGGSLWLRLRDVNRLGNLQDLPAISVLERGFDGVSAGRRRSPVHRVGWSPRCLLDEGTGFASQGYSQVRILPRAPAGSSIPPPTTPARRLSRPSSRLHTFVLLCR